MSEPRVVVTGMGWVTSLGHTVDGVWKRLMNSESGMAPITHFKAGTFPTTFAAQVKPDFDYRTFLSDPKAHSTTALNAQFALGAARQAWNQAGFHAKPPQDPRRVGLYLGAGEGVLDFDNYAGALIAAWDAGKQKVDGARWTKAALARLDAFKELEQEPNMSLAHLAREFGIRGPASNCLTACAASTQAIGEAFSMIQRGDADIMMSGGTHTMIHPLGVTGFNRLTALSTFKGDPTMASRPFCMSRDGFVMGEGSGMVILEKLEHALARGCKPLAEVIGYGSSADAFRITDIQPEGRGAAAAIHSALKQARIDPSAVGPDGRPLIHYISAHGTGTKENDSIETRAVKVVFGERARLIPMSSIKSMMGHLIAAAGAVEFMTCILAIEHGMLPPTRNHHDPDPALDLDYVPNVARPCQVDTCISNSFGFGGQNDTLVVTRYKTQ